MRLHEVRFVNLQDDTLRIERIESIGDATHLSPMCSRLLQRALGDLARLVYLFDYNTNFEETAIMTAHSFYDLKIEGTSPSTAVSL